MLVLYRRGYGWIDASYDEIACLVDDIVRSVFSGGVVLGGDSSAASADLPILREAVEASTRRFASWIADSLEILVGDESSDPKDVMDASLFIEDEEGSRSDNPTLILAIAEMCRLAEHSVTENWDQSIATHLGGGKKK
jgi:hypothetical protein